MLSHLDLWFAVFRWFKFTLKPPYSGAHERSLLAIWDTSHWNVFVKFGLRTAWDISYDILLSLLKFVNFWRLQGHLSILAKIGCLQKIKVFSMKERRGFNVTWGVLGSQITRLYDGTILWGGVMHLRGSRGPSKKLKLKNYIFRHICTGLKDIQYLLISSRISP